MRLKPLVHMADRRKRFYKSQLRPLLAKTYALDPCAMLDDRGSGVVMTSINGRHDTRVYAKPVSEGHSPYSLSVEEEEAIKQALEPGAEQAVSAT